jgi:carbonic anhydrase
MLATSIIALFTFVATVVAEPLPNFKYNCLGEAIDSRYGEFLKRVKRSTTTTTNSTAPAAHWGYEDAEGPAHWGDFGATCEAGKIQTPINFEDNTFLVDKKPTLTWGKKDVTGCNITDNGHTIQVNVPQNGQYYFTRDGKNYNLLQFHWHAPSEHRVEGSDFPLEVHFVHKSADGELAVVGVFFEMSKTWEPFLAQFIPFFPVAVPVNTPRALPPINLENIYNHIQDSQSYWSYKGSLTTPPCTEGVHWLVVSKPAALTVGQYLAYKKALKFNSRFTQPVNNVASRKETYDDYLAA